MESRPLLFAVGRKGWRNGAWRLLLLYVLLSVAVQTLYLARWLPHQRCFEPVVSACTFISGKPPLSASLDPQQIATADESWRDGSLVRAIYWPDDLGTSAARLKHLGLTTIVPPFILGSLWMLSTSVVVVIEHRSRSVGEGRWRASPAEVGLRSLPAFALTIVLLEGMSSLSSSVRFAPFELWINEASVRATGVLMAVACIAVLARVARVVRQRQASDAGIRVCRSCEYELEPVSNALTCVECQREITPGILRFWTRRYSLGVLCVFTALVLLPWLVMRGLDALSSEARTSVQRACRMVFLAG